MKTDKQYLYYIVTIFVFIIVLMGTKAKAAAQTNKTNRKMTVSVNTNTQDQVVTQVVFSNGNKLTFFQDNFGTLQVGTTVGVKTTFTSFDNLKDGNDFVNNFVFTNSF